jgi:1,4-alpha-glucan branching enzyme
MALSEHRGAYPVVAMVIALVVSAGAAPLPSQPPDLLPRRVEEGILFQCYAPSARVVHLAGDFNHWLSNEEGWVRGDGFPMDGPDEAGIWSKIIRLDPGRYRFKFNVDGSPDGWHPPDSITDRDRENSALFRVGRDGSVTVRTAVNPAWRPRPQAAAMTFFCYAPDAHVVYFAGEFNQWAENRQGLVYKPAFQMEGPDGDGVWRKTVPLGRGTYRYQFVIDGDRWMRDPNAPASSDRNHSRVEVP